MMILLKPTPRKKSTIAKIDNHMKILNVKGIEASKSDALTKGKEKRKSPSKEKTLLAAVE
jgi:hypothetical protein